jgi:hypothetical protein
MSERLPLPFPTLVDLGTQACLACGYSLEGIPSPGDCPECGLAFDEGVSALMIHGVPKTIGGPRWRKVVWIIIAVAAFVFAQGMVFWIRYPLLALAWVGVIVASAVGMAVTNRQKKTGTEIIVFTRFGIGQWSNTKKDEDDRNSMFIPWQGVKRGATIKRISSVWSRLKIRSVDEKGKHRVNFDSGIRCQATDIPVITQIIDRLAEGQWIDDIEGVELIGTHDEGLDTGQGFYIADDLIEPEAREDGVQ